MTAPEASRTLYPMMEFVVCLILQDELTAEKAEALFIEAYKHYLAEERDDSTRKFTKIYDKFPKEPIGAIAAYNIACNYALDEEKDKALEWLKKALDAGYDNFDHVESDPDLEPLREEKEYEEMLKEAKKKAPKEKRAPIKQEDAKKFAETIHALYKKGDENGVRAHFSRFGWFAHEKTAEWLNAELKKKGLKLTGEDGNWQLEEIGD